MKKIHLFDQAEDAVFYDVGAVIFTQDSYADTLYVLVEGSVDIVRNAQRLATIEDGSLLGEMAILEQRPHYASAVAKTPCKLVPLSRQRFRFLIEETPNFALDVMEIMAERLHLMDQRCVQAK